MAGRRTVYSEARSSRPRPGRRVVALIATLVATLVGVLGAPAAASAVDEGAILSLVNQSRAGSGLGPLNLNAAMSRVALNWANQMAANGAISHNPDYAGQIPAGWSRAAENVASGYASGSAVHQGWMGSEGHRANILGDFTDIGIAHISVAGTTWSVEVFAKYGGTVAAPRPAPQPASQPASQPAPQSAPQPAPPPPAAEPPPAAPSPEPEIAPPTPQSGTPPPSHPPSSSPEPAQDAAGTVERADDGGSMTKLVLGVALLVSLVIAIAGCLRLRLRR